MAATWLALTKVPRSPSTVRWLCGCGSVWIAAISGLPSVIECTSVVAPPTSTTTRSPSVVGQPLGGEQHGARRGQDAAVHDLADALHAGRVDDVLLEGVVDDGARRHDVELVDCRVDVAGEPHPKAGPLEQLAGVARRRPSCRRRRRSAAARARASRSALNSTVSQSPPSTPPASRMRLGRDLLDRAQVVVAQQAGGLVLDDGAGPERGLARRHGRHALREAVDGHAQAAGGRARGQGEARRERPGRRLRGPLAPRRRRS